MSMAYGAYDLRDLVAAAAIVLCAATFALLALKHKDLQKIWNSFLKSFNFFYATFLKPHTGDGDVQGQQAALESFYKAQVSTLDHQNGPSQLTHVLVVGRYLRCHPQGPAPRA